MAANMSGREAVWLVQARNTYGVDPIEMITLQSTQLTNHDKPSPPTAVISCDNQGAIHLLGNNHIKKSSKHIDITFHWSREQVERGRLKFVYIPGVNNIADLFTKSLPAPAFREFRDGLGLVDGRTLSYFK